MTGLGGLLFVFFLFYLYCWSKDCDAKVLEEQRMQKLELELYERDEKHE